MSEEIQKVEGYSLMEMDAEQLGKIIEQNIGDQGINRFDLDSIGVPSGGATRWTVPTLEGDEAQEAITGIIIHWKDVRAFWSTDYSGGNTPPECYSDDARKGVGDPGGKCSECPYSQWGSGSGDAQACKKMRIIFLIRSGDILPVVITSPPTSLTNIKKYFMRLASRGIPYYGVVSSLELEKAVSGGGIEYSKIVPKYESKLNDDQLKDIKAIKDILQPKLEVVSVDERSNVVDVGEEPYEVDVDVEEEEV